MAHPILSLKRRFQVWDYTVSHGMLLLRSVKDAQHPTRYDVLFKAVKSMQLPTLMDDLYVAEADEVTAKEIVGNLGGWQFANEKIFVVWGSGFRGYVVAHIVAAAEDDHDHNAPSQLVGPSLVEMWNDPRRSHDLSD